MRNHPSATYRPGDVVTAEIQGVVESKSRPAVVLCDTGDADLVVIPVTKQGPRGEFDVIVSDWKQAGFQVQCYVRVNKPVTIQKANINRKPGALTANDWAKVRAALAKLVGPLIA